MKTFLFKYKKVFIISASIFTVFVNCCSSACYGAILYRVINNGQVEDYVSAVKDDFIASSENINFAGKTFAEGFLQNSNGYEEYLKRLEDEYSHTYDILQQSRDSKKALPMKFPSEVYSLHIHLEDYYEIVYATADDYGDTLLYFENITELKIELDEKVMQYSKKGYVRESYNDSKAYLKILKNQYEDIQILKRKFEDVEAPGVLRQHKSLKVEEIDLLLAHLESWIKVVKAEAKAFQSNSLTLLNETIKEGNDENKKYQRRIGTQIARIKKEEEIAVSHFKEEFERLSDEAEIVQMEFTYLENR